MDTRNIKFKILTGGSVAANIASIMLELNVTNGGHVYFGRIQAVPRAAPILDIPSIMRSE